MRVKTNMGTFISVGEAPAPLPKEGENGGGGKFPSQISHRKDQPGSPWNERKDTNGPLIQFGCGQKRALEKPPGMFLAPMSGLWGYPNIMRSYKDQKRFFVSFPRRRESSLSEVVWTPAGVYPREGGGGSDGPDHFLQGYQT